jgi:hypothetical protein
MQPACHFTSASVAHSNADSRISYNIGSSGANPTPTPPSASVVTDQVVAQMPTVDNTMLYTQLISFKDGDFTVTVAHSEEEACKLIEAGFEYVCYFGQSKLFRKRK